MTLTSVKRLYMGGISNEHRQRWYDLCRQWLREGRQQFRMVLPTRLLIREARLAIMGEHGHLAISNQVVTIDDIVDDVVRKSAPGRIHLDGRARLEAFQRAWEMSPVEGRAAFASFADQPGWDESLLAAIDDWRRSGISAAEWLTCDPVAAGVRMADLPLLEAVRSLVTSYQGTLEEGFLDAIEAYVIAAHHLRENGAELLSGIDAIFLDYVTLTPLQVPLLLAIAQHVPQVEIYAPFNAAWHESIPQYAKAMDEFVAALASCGVEHVAGDPADLPLGRERVYIPSSSSAQEIRAVAKEIRRLTGTYATVEETEQVTLVECCVVLPDDSNYRQKTLDIFREQGIALQMPDIRMLGEVPLLRALTAVVELRDRRFHRDLLLSIATAPYLQNGVRPPVRLASYLRRSGYVQGDKWLLELLARESESLTASKPDSWEARETKRAYTWLQALQREAAHFPERATWSEWLEVIQAWWKRLDLPRILYRWVAERKEYNIAHLQRDLAALDKLMENLDSVGRSVRLFRGNYRVSYHDFVAEWNRIIRRERVIVHQGDPAGVAVLRAMEMRGMEFPYVFVVGLNQGVVPSPTKAHWLTDRFRQLWSDKPSNAHEQKELQFIWFRFCMAAAQSRLYISYIDPHLDEKMLPSPFLESLWSADAAERSQVQENLAHLQDAKAVLPIPSSWEAVSTAREHEERAALWLGGVQTLHVPIDAPVDEPMMTEAVQHAAQATRWEHIHTVWDIERERAYVVGSSWDGRLQTEESLQHIRSLYPPDHLWSVSRLNRYAMCTFQFFSTDLLRLEQEDEAEDGIPAAARGQFLHELLHALLLPWKRKLPWDASEPLPTPHTVDESGAVVERVFADVEANWGDSSLQNRPLWRWERARLLETLSVWYRQEVESLLETGLRPGYLEWSFGMPLDGDETSDPASISDPIGLPIGGKTLQLRGRIDRIDFDKSGTWALFYDYKTSLASYGGQTDIENGLDFQLPMYIDSFIQWQKTLGRNIQPIGAAYYELKERAERKGIWTAKAKALGLAGKNSKEDELDTQFALTMEVARAHLARQQEDLKHGVFDAMPRVGCDPYCPFTRVCRFEPMKKERKGGGSL